MNALIRQLLEQTGGVCPLPDTDPDVWLAPDGRLGRVVVVTEADSATDTPVDWAFVPLVTH
jgi:hypothetical protein